MTDEELKQAIAELQEVVRCRCDEAYRDRGLHDPQCECDTAEAVKIVADRIEQLVATNEALTKERDEHWNSFVHWRKEADDRAEQLTAAQQDAKEAEVYAEEVEKERDDYAHKLMQANNTYTGMHLEIERLSDKLATCEKYRDAYAECDRIGTQAVRDLEAKLAKAMEALGGLMPHMPDYADTAWQDARATLAEIKGESHE